MSLSPEARDYQYVCEILREGDAKKLEELAALVDGFPHGQDGWLHRAWLTNAIDLGALATIEWMLEQGVDVTYRDDEGYSPAHSALERRTPDRLVVLEMLLEHGASPNVRGIHGWTPAHMAAARDDVDALRLLVRHGADLSLRTLIDDDATPLEEARRLRKAAAVEYLERVIRG